MSSSARSLADAIASTARRQGANTPEVRGADWHTATVTAVGTDGTVDCGTIRARRLAAYQNPTVGDLVVLLRSGSGNFIAAGRWATTPGTAWTTYTPAWTSGGTNPTLGNGTLIGRYDKVGRTVHLHIDLVAGSTTNFGAGSWSFSIPVTAASTGTGTRVGDAHTLVSASPTERYAGQCLISPDGTTTQPFFPSATLTPITRLAQASPVIPGTWTSGNQLRMTITYESAS